MDVFALVLNLKHLVLVAGAVAVFAGQFHIREKLHLHRHRAVALAGIASAARHVEGEMSRGQRQPLGLGLRSKQFTDKIEALDVGNGIRSRRSSNRRLINQHDIIEPFDASQ